MSFAIFETGGFEGVPCELCGEPTQSCGFDVMLLTTEGGKPICNNCSERHTPELLYLRTIAANILTVDQSPKPDKQTLLDHYAGGTVQQFIQIDAHPNGVGTCDPGYPDDDRDSVTSVETWELRRSGSELAIRVFIHTDARSSDVVRLIQEISEFVVSQFGNDASLSSDAEQESSAKPDESHSALAQQDHSPRRPHEATVRCIWEERARQAIRNQVIRELSGEFDDTELPF